MGSLARKWSRYNLPFLARPWKATLGARNLLTQSAQMSDSAVSPYTPPGSNFQSVQLPRSSGQGRARRFPDCPRPAHSCPELAGTGSRKPRASSRWKGVPRGQLCPYPSRARTPRWGALLVSSYLECTSLLFGSFASMGQAVSRALGRRRSPRH